MFQIHIFCFFLKFLERMSIHYCGLNLAKKTTDRFFINDPSLNDLTNFYLTFDSIYLIKDQKEILKFEFETKKFNNLDLKIDKIQYVCSNTNYLNCLIINDNIVKLIQLSGSRLVNEISLNHLKSIENLLIASSDINLYLFENENGLRCKYELNSSKDKDIKQLEDQLNENAISSLPIDVTIINDNINQIEAGKEHCLLLTKSGQVYSFGLGTKGQLGHGKIENCYEPKRIDSLKHTIILISCGGWHSGALDQEYNVYIWGWNASNQLGLVESEDSVFVSIPTKILMHNQITNEQIKFSNISLGTRHSALIDLENNLYTFGWNKYDQLFQDHEQEFDEPTKVYDYEKKVKYVKCGCWFTLISIE